MTFVPQPGKGIAAYTIFDVLVFIAGFVIGGWVSSYFEGSARTWVFWISSIASGILLWCCIFLWFIPLRTRGKRSRIKSKRQRIAEHAALLTFLRESATDHVAPEYAIVIGEDDKRCIVEIGYGNARPGDRCFYSVADGTCSVSAVSMKEVVEHWGVQYER